MNNDSPSHNAGWLASLGLVGMRPIEAPLLAALITEQPLLLIGPHSTAKSLLLNRVAAALGLTFRHYNASLLSFDDLVGYPVPDASGNLQFVKTPAAIWGAQAVFIDEISRARPEIQNKIFPVVHERRVQGIDLPDLIHRWAAMNPPLVEGEGSYLGSEPLDLALADRFAFHLQIPSWQGLSEGDRRKVLRNSESPSLAHELDSLLEEIREGAQVLSRQAGDQLADYVLRMTAGMAAAGVPVSARRAVMIMHNIALVYAAAFGPTGGLISSIRLGQAAWLALMNSLPFQAVGKAYEPLKLLALHREQAVIAFAGQNDNRTPILLERDPLRRLSLTLEAKGLEPDERGALIMDAISGLAPGASEACAWWIVHTGVHTTLPLAVTEDLAALYREAAVPTRIVDRIGPQTERGKTFALFEALSKKTRNDRPAQVALLNLLSSRFRDNAVEDPSQFNDLVKGWWGALEVLDPPLTIGVA